MIKARTATIAALLVLAGGLLGCLFNNEPLPCGRSTCPYDTTEVDTVLYVMHPTAHDSAVVRMWERLAKEREARNAAR